MDIVEQLKYFEKGIKASEANLEKLKEDFERIKNKTLEFLDICKNVGIKKVGISKRDESFTESENWSFSSKYSVFSDEMDENNYPAIWRAVKLMGISGECGNSGQHQITTEATQFLQEGIYEFKNGKWYFKE